MTLSKKYNKIYDCLNCSGTGKSNGGEDDCEMCRGRGEIGISKKNNKKVNSYED